MKSNYTQIANRILEALSITRMSNEETRIMYVIFRKTYGWGKKQDKIAISQFVELAKMDRRHVSRTLKKLEKKNMIFIIKGYVNYYQFNSHPETWELSPK